MFFFIDWGVFEFVGMIIFDWKDLDVLGYFGWSFVQLVF